MMITLTELLIIGLIWAWVSSSRESRESRSNEEIHLEWEEEERLEREKAYKASNSSFASVSRRLNKSWASFILP